MPILFDLRDGFDHRLAEAGEGSYPVSYDRKPRTVAYRFRRGLYQHLAATTCVLVKQIFDAHFPPSMFKFSTPFSGKLRSLSSRTTSRRFIGMKPCSCSLFAALPKR